MSTLTSLFGGAGGGTPINGIAQFANAPTLYTDLDNKVWLRAGNISTDTAAYPDAIKKGSVNLFSYSQNFDILSIEATPRGLFFKPDGTKVYFTGEQYDLLHEYNLSTAWNITTATAVRTYNITEGNGDYQPQSIFFREDGLRFYFAGLYNNLIYEYSLTTAWNISTMTLTRTFSVISQGGTVRGLFFKPDGTKFFTVSNNDVYEYSLTTAWNISTASYKRVFDPTSTPQTSYYSVWFDTSGSTMYLASNNSISIYTLSAPYFINTAVFFDNIPITPSFFLYGIYIRDDFQKMYLMNSNNRKIDEYTSPLAVGLSSITGMDANSYVRIK